MELISTIKNVWRGNWAIAKVTARKESKSEKRTVGIEGGHFILSLTFLYCVRAVTAYSDHMCTQQSLTV
jgi:hypothetical protein